MTEIEGILESSHRGAGLFGAPDREPVEISSGELFRVYVDGEMKLTRMEFRHLDFRDLDAKIDIKHRNPFFEVCHSISSSLNSAPALRPWRDDNRTSWHGLVHLDGWD
jgi:hypothetical protein